MNKKKYKCSYAQIVKSQLVILINAKNRNLRKSIILQKKKRAVEVKETSFCSHGVNARIQDSR